MRRTGIVALLAAAGTGVVVMPATSASAAAGVIGHIDSVRMTMNVGSCFPEDPAPCQYGWDEVSTTGWTFNPRTAPVQEIYFSFSGTIQRVSGSRQAQNWNSRTYLANRTRTDVQRHYGLNTAAVGYSTSFQTVHTGWYISTVKVCLHARDHGTRQAWITVACKSVTPAN